MSAVATPNDVRRRYGVPGALGLRVDRREVLAWLPGHEVSVREVAAHPDDIPASVVGGRRRLRRLEGPDGPLLVREYAKGGLLRRLRGSRFHGRWRPLDELVLHVSLLALGVPVPRAVGCVVLRSPLGWRGFLLMEEVEEAVDLERWLHDPRIRRASDPRRVAEASGRAVRRLHDAGVPHPDLHPKNLLLAPAGRVFLVDLDKARAAHGRLPEETRLANLVRLCRAVEKHRLKGGRVGGGLALRFLAAYAGEAPAARQWLRRIRHRLGRGLRARALWWRLGGQTRPWRDPAAEDA